MLPKLNILLVDDDDATNYYNKLILTRANIVNTIQIANNGQQALDYLTRKGNFANRPANIPQPDLIFLDLHMPVLDGWGFLDAYNELDEIYRGKIVIMMLTNSPYVQDQLKSKNYNILTKFMKKPLRINMVEEILEKHYSELV